MVKAFIHTALCARTYRGGCSRDNMHYSTYLLKFYVEVYYIIMISALGS